MRINEIQIDSSIFLQKREKLRCSVREVEEITGVSRSTISNMETGKNIPDGENLIRLMFFYDLSKEEIALSQ